MNPPTPTPPSPSSPPPASGFEDRLLRLEEACGFLEHHVEQLNAEVTRANRLASDLAARIARMETSTAPGPPEPQTSALTLAQAERQIIAQALTRASGSLDDAAISLGIDRAGLERKLINHGLV